MFFENQEISKYDNNSNVSNDKTKKNIIILQI